MIRKILTLVFVVIFLCSAPAYPQRSTAPEEKVKTDEAALRAKAFALLESLAGEMGTLQSPENRARIGSNIAGSLWPHNEQRARDLITLVQQDISANLQVPEQSSAESNHSLLVFLNLRSDTVQRIAKRDPELAHSFFKATEPERARLPYTVQNKEQELELFLAKQIAATNPDIAVELSLKSAKHEFTDDLRFVLRQLNRKHKDQAAVLYKALVRKLRDTDISLRWDARNFAIGLVNSISPPAVDETSFRELVGIFIKLSISNQCTQRSEEYDTQQNCLAVGATLEQIAKVDPLRASRLKQWAPQTHYGEGPLPGSRELNDVAADGSVDEILAFASRYPGLKDQVLWRAATKAREEGDYERARKIITEYEGYPAQKATMLDQLARDQGQLAVDNERFTAERKKIAGLPRFRDRAVYSIALAREIAVRDRTAALKLLDEAGEMLDTMKPGLEKAQGQLLLATAYCAADSDRGLQVMEGMIPGLNELVEAAVRLDGFDTRYVREGEWNMSAQGPLGSLLTLLSNNASYFAWSDFDRAVEVAGRFQRPEIRMMGQLKLAQAILAGPQKRKPFIDWRNQR